MNLLVLAKKVTGMNLLELTRKVTGIRLSPWTLVTTALMSYNIYNTYINFRQETIYSIIPLSQQMLSIIYHRNKENKFKQWMNKYTVNFGINEQLIGVCVISLSGAFTIYKSITEHLDLLNCILLLCSSLIVTESTLELFYVFYKHYKVVCELVVYTQKITEHEYTYLLENVIDVKFDFENSVNNFKHIFAITSVLGAIPVTQSAVCIENDKCEQSPAWWYVSFYMVYQVVFYLITKQIDGKTTCISNIIKHREFRELYIKKTNINNRTSSSIDWLLLNNISSSSWSQIAVLGVNVSDGGSLKIGALIAWMLILSNKLSDVNLVVSSVC